MDHDEIKRSIEESIRFAGLVGSEDEADEKGEKRRLSIDLGGARTHFFMRALKEGLTTHQALHSWVSALDMEVEVAKTLTVGQFCTPRLAEGLGATIAELEAAHPLVLQYAIQAGITLAEAERRARARDN